MIARKTLPAAHVDWNRRWGAPYGRAFYVWSQSLPRGSGVVERALFTPFPSLRGPFGFQDNNTTRRAEYPWAFHATAIVPGLKVLEIGGGLAGFQFVLARSGCDVSNVDPGMESHGRGWHVDREGIARLNRAFGTRVVLHPHFLQDAPLAKGTFDRIYSISVIEHIPVTELPGIMALAYELLKPGGCFVMTVDLFLNLKPFCSAETNEFGTNVSIRMLAESAPFELAGGDRSELLGYPEFDQDRILCNLSKLLLGVYPALAQLVVLKKPESA